jgi:hypothetical protein
MDRLIENILTRITRLEKNSHPPVNWKELIQSNIIRIEDLERKINERNSK